MIKKTFQTILAMIAAGVLAFPSVNYSRAEPVKTEIAQSQYKLVDERPEIYKDFKKSENKVGTVDDYYRLLNFDDNVNSSGKELKEALRYFSDIYNKGYIKLNQITEDYSNYKLKDLSLKLDDLLKKENVFEKFDVKKLKGNGINTEELDKELARLSPFCTEILVEKAIFDLANGNYKKAKDLIKIADSLTKRYATSFNEAQKGRGLFTYVKEDVFNDELKKSLVSSKEIADIFKNENKESFYNKNIVKKYEALINDEVNKKIQEKGLKESDSEYNMKKCEIEAEVEKSIDINNIKVTFEDLINDFKENSSYEQLSGAAHTFYQILKKKSISGETIKSQYELFLGCVAYLIDGVESNEDKNLKKKDFTDVGQWVTVLKDMYKDFIRYVKR